MLVPVTGGNIFIEPIKIYLDMAILFHLATVSVKAGLFLFLLIFQTKSTHMPYSCVCGHITPFFLKESIHFVM
jgi:hypothetical protein